MDNQIQFYTSQENKPKSSKKLLITLIILIPIIFFVAIGTKVFLDLKSAREKANAIMNQQKNINPADLQKSQQDYVKNYKPTASATFDKCMKSCQGSDCGNFCLTKEAILKNDMSACSALDNSLDIDGKDSGKARCQAEVAAATLDLSNCEKITYGSDFIKEFNKYQCYDMISKTKKDKSICEKIPKNYMLGNMYKDCVARK